MVNKKRGKVFLWIGICTLLLMVTTCTTFQAGGFQMGLNARGPNYEILGNFSTKIWVAKFLGQSGGQTLFNISSSVTDSPIRDAIEKEIQKKGGTAAVNIKITWGSNPVQWILNTITFRILAPGTATITGTVIKEK